MSTIQICKEVLNIILYNYHRRNVRNFEYIPKRVPFGYVRDFEYHFV